MEFAFDTGLMHMSLVLVVLMLSPILVLPAGVDIVTLDASGFVCCASTHDPVDGDKEEDWVDASLAYHRLYG